MKYLFQFMIICAVTFAAEVLSKVIPIPIPASIYGLVIMLVLLCTHIIKLDHVEQTADFMVKIMPVMFVPPGVAMMVYWEIIRDNFFIIFFVNIVTTVLVMAVTGLAAQAIMRRQKKGKEGDADE
ncbi:MAG: CidA/LrgA family protein [Lachnospiraceae bacterium]|nr:CidA/LrgA family protein [Lachnospiraceae bacterium]